MTGNELHDIDVYNLNVDSDDEQREDEEEGGSGNRSASDSVVTDDNDDCDTDSIAEAQERLLASDDHQNKRKELLEGGEDDNNNNNNYNYNITNGFNICDTSPSHQGDMSLKENRNQMPVTVFRSKSFAGMVNARPRSAPGTPVLGETLRRSPRVYTQPPQRSKRLGIGSHKPPKIPKLPQPSRAVLMFESVKKGIREFIAATQDDIVQLKSRDANTSTAQVDVINQQIKAAERYLKRLEFHLSKIDELQDCYIVNQQLREGARNMARAYANTPGYKKGSLTSVKYGFKECSQTMCAIEAQLESMMGTFHCKLKGMAGFARLCPGDVFEVTMRYGSQKWKAKGRIEKDGSQRWDVADYIFKTLVGDIISLKAVELRSLKSVLLGEKKCETKDLFSANPQMMTVSINPNGSLKLSIIVTWNPLEGVDESVTIYEVPQRTQETPRRRPVSVLALNGQYSQMFGSQLDLLGHERRYSTPVSSSLSQSKDDSFILSSSSSSLSLAATGYSITNSTDSAIYISQLPQRSNSRSMLSGSAMAMPPPIATSGRYPTGLGHQTVCAYTTDSSNLEDALNSLSLSLEDVRGRYHELQKIEELTDVLRSLLKKNSRSSSCSSNISVSIEHALEAFDFLNAEDGLDDADSSPGDSRRSSLEHILASPESTAKTTDSGIESLAKRLSEDTQLSSSTSSSPLPPSTGNEQVDQAFIFHLNYCNKLIENLGSFGPLKCKEIYALDKLEKQSLVLDSLINLAKAGNDVDLHAVLAEQLNDKQLKEFWVQCVDQNVLTVPADKLISLMEQKLSNRFQEQSEVKPCRVFCHIVSRILDISDAELKMTQNVYITLYQFALFFKPNGFTLVDRVIEEISISDRLCSGNPEVAIRSIENLHGTIAPSFCLKVLGTLLICDNKDIRQAAASYLKNLQQTRISRDKSMIVYVEALEDQTAEVRAGAAVALSLLQANESIPQLVYLCQTDPSTSVTTFVKDALYSLGLEGRKAYEEAQLGCHGFQGLHVRK